MKKLVPHSGRFLCRYAGLLLLAIWLIHGHVFSQALASADKAAKVQQNRALKQQQNNFIPLKEVLSEIEAIHKVHFGFESKIIEDKRVDKNLFEKQKGADIESTLNSLLYPLNLKYKELRAGNYVIYSKEEKALKKIKKIENNNLNSVEESIFPQNLLESLQKKGQELVPSQAITVSGTVTSYDDEEPLPGGNILLKGTGTGTITDINGKYTISVPDEDAALVFSFIGFVPEEVQVKGRSVIDIALVPDITSLEEVVVIGYGTRKKKDVTGAVSSANLEDFRQAPVSNVGQLLQGNLPGLNVGQVNSAGSTPSISVRGRTTISGNQDVLIVLDGIQYNGSLESINPNDIESIDVLKDASSVAVYGAQGANGVILITTKQGKRNQKPKISISTSYATLEPSTDLRPLNRAEFLEHVRMLNYENAYLAPDYVTPNPDFDLADYVDASMLDENGNIVDTNFGWWDAGTQVGFINQQKISLSGGSEKTSYLISLDHTKQEGFIINDKFQRKGARVNLSTDATDWLEMGVQSFASFVNKDGDEPGISGLVRTSPLLQPYDEEGNLIPNPANTADTNPFLGYDTEDYNRHDYFFANFFAVINFPFLEGLSYRVNYGNNYRINKNYGASEYGSGLRGSAYKNHSFYYDYNLDNIVNYNKSFGKHNIDLTLLYGAIERQYEYTGADANDFTRLDLGYNSLEQGVNQFTYSDAWREALNYQMIRVNYVFDDRYLLTGTLRRDGFSGFAANNKFGYFPSVAVAWNISNEDFLNTDWINNLKLRVGYGTTSNQTSRYSSLARVTTGAAYVFGDGGSTVFRQSLNSLANPDLKWERTTGINLGVDYGFFNSRLNGSIEYYYNRTNDLLFDVAIPDITGFETIPTNIGEIENQGFEFAISSQNIRTDNFNWNTTINFSTTATKILKLLGRDNDGDGVEDDLIASNLFIGEPIGVIYDYETDGIYQIGDDIPEDYFSGSYRVIDQNRDGDITPEDDRVIKGHSNPAYRFSMLNKFSYKGFSLRVFINSIQGGENGYMQNNIYPIRLNDNNIRWNHLNNRDLWQPNNPDGVDPVFLGRSPQISPAVYEDRSFIRLQDVSLAYNFNNKLLDKLHLDKLQVFISGKNLATWTNWRGWDPEMGTGLGSGGRPVLKSYSLGLNVSF